MSSTPVKTETRATKLKDTESKKWALRLPYCHNNNDTVSKLDTEYVPSLARTRIETKTVTAVVALNNISEGDTRTQRQKDFTPTPHSREGREGERTKGQGTGALLQRRDGTRDTGSKDSSGSVVAWWVRHDGGGRGFPPV